jgi:hypothetical protein
MRRIVFIAVCVGVLRGFDSLVFNGRYRTKIAEETNSAALKFNRSVDGWLDRLRFPLRG